MSKNTRRKTPNGNGSFRYLLFYQKIFETTPEDCDAHELFVFPVSSSAQEVRSSYNRSKRCDVVIRPVWKDELGWCFVGFVFDSRSRKILRNSQKHSPVAGNGHQDFSYDFREDSLIALNKDGGVTAITHFMNLYCP